jgi:2-oxopent-4-enoate/cis-2-oxohex-4-enoate hydratase
VSLTESTIDRLGAELNAAWCEARPIAPLTERYPDITLAEAYAIQRQLLARRRTGGARVVGKKIGVTSRAVMDMLKVAEPDFGVLLDDMACRDGETVEYRRLIAPRAEGEIAFVLKRTLRGPGVTAAMVFAATEFVMPCFEIVDSRITDWKIKIQDTVADNASSALFVLGDRAVRPDEVDLRTVGMVLEHNGDVVVTGAGAAALGSPLNAVAWLANRLADFDEALEAGEVILSGSLAAMVPVKAGDTFRVWLGGIGSAAIRFV